MFQGFTKEITMEKDRWQGYGDPMSFLKFIEIGVGR
jgi:hypothetical protein